MTITVSRLLVAATIALSATPSHHAAAQQLSAWDSVIVERDVMIPVRDGKRMATDIYRPVRNNALAERLPVLLERTPYNKTASKDIAQNFAAHGYVVAVQDIRGR